MTLFSATTSHARMPAPRKIGWIVAMALATAIPGFLVSQLIGERESRATTAQADIVTAWGPQQRVSGPMLVLPSADKAGAPYYRELAPRNLEVKASIVPTTRRRGLFATTVYEATLVMSGSFDLPEGFREEGPDSQTPGSGLVALGLSGTQGVRDEDRAEVAGVKQPWQACVDVLTGRGGCRSGDILVARVDLSKAQGPSIPFTLNLHLRGTAALRIATTAKHATAHIEGTWPTPSFVGTELPVKAASTDKGFEAAWTLDRIGQPKYVKMLLITTLDDQASSVGVDLIEGAPVYRTITRVTKYGLLIVALAFSAYFLFEVVTGVAVALFQYAMLGASLSLFTLLLLSVSEVVGYKAGYATSAVLVTAQASVYTLSVTHRPRAAAAFAALLGTVLGFFYVLVGLETYSLVLGSAALFLVLSILMGVTQTVSGSDAPQAPRSISSDEGVLDADGR